jgi:hypothetical protein
MSENGRVLTCVYCGQEYPQDTPAWGDKVLTDHIKVCEKYPMRKVLEDNIKLRKALVGLVGEEKKEELENMELFLRAVPVQSADVLAAINAVQVLLATIEAV